MSTAPETGSRGGHQTEVPERKANQSGWKTAGNTPQQAEGASEQEQDSLTQSGGRNKTRLFYVK